MNDDNNLDLLDLDDDDSVDSLPDVPAFTTPRPKKPWLLLSVGIAVIVLATYIIIHAIGDDSASTVEVDLDAPVEFVVEGDAEIVTDETKDMNVMPPVKPVQVEQKIQPKPQPVQDVKKVEPKPQVQVQQQEEAAVMPVRVVEERKEVKFNPEAKPSTDVKPRPVESKPKTVQRTAVKSQQKKAENKNVAARTSVSAWYVQFGSYSTRALAEAAQRKIANEHKSLFAGKQFVILAAQLKNGTTTYRLRVGFQNANDANGFCRNAKSDGLDCYVAK
ncbi:MAG: SPOR domain-containing protein [Alphaproteobacteria bacterium]|nr:SPOR domain-containing protein [Alphaproteobacteria bacterium]